MKTLTKADIAEEVFKKVGLAKTDSVKLISLMLEKVSSSLKSGDKIKISGFGTFETRQKKERIGRNPKTGEEAVISSRRVVSFKPSTLLREDLNKS